MCESVDTTRDRQEKNKTSTDKGPSLTAVATIIGAKVMVVEDTVGHAVVVLLVLAERDGAVLRFS
jgi:hypothetical protein